MYFILQIALKVDYITTVLKLNYTGQETFIDFYNGHKFSTVDSNT